jgi:hypothetical protein
MADIIDCSDALAKIEAIRRSQEALGKPIEAQLVNWGLQALAREAPERNIRHRWQSLDDTARWRRVRMNLSAQALIALQRVLERRYGSPVEQISLLEKQSHGA